MRYDDDMIAASTYSIVRPTVTLVCFDTIAATMSVPPLEPLCVKVMPTPKPAHMPPMTMFMNGSEVKVTPSSKGWKMPMNIDSMVAP